MVLGEANFELEAIEVEILRKIQEHNPTERALFKLIGRNNIIGSELNLRLRGLEVHDYIDRGQERGEYYLKQKGAKRIDIHPNDIIYPPEMNGQFNFGFASDR